MSTLSNRILPFAAPRLGAPAAMLLAATLVLGACRDSAPSGLPQIPARLELILLPQPVFTGEVIPFEWRLFDERDRVISRPPASAEPKWTTSSEIVKVVGSRVEAVAPGDATVTLDVAGFTATKSVRINPGGMRVELAGAYISQGIQRFDGSIPLVAGRAGHMRVFITGDELNFFQPVVRVRFFRNGNPLTTLTAVKSSLGIPLSLEEGSLTKSWNVAVPGSLISPGTSFLVQIEMGTGMRAGAGSVLHYPANSVPLLMDVRAVNPFRITFVPIHIIGFATGDVTASNVMSQYMSAAREVWPMHDLDVIVREPYSTNTRSLTDQDWSDLLREIRNLRTAESSTRYYHGILRREGAWSGLGYVGFPVAISRDGSSAWTVAHELGHNFGRRHAPCGGPSGVDTNYPHEGGGIGVYGLSLDGKSVHPPSRPDLMTYCSPRWVSDYSFLGALNYRLGSPTREPVTGVFGTPAEREVLIVSGEVGAGSARIDPAFVATAVPSLPSAPGPYTLEGVGSGGAILFSVSFAGESLGDGPEDLRHFSFAIPLASGTAGSLAVLRLSGGGVTVERRSAAASAAAGAGAVPPPAADVVPDVAIVATAFDEVTLRWDAVRYPLLVVRNPASNALLAMARGGEATIKSTARQLELGFSDGVVSTTRVVTVPGR